MRPSDGILRWAIKRGALLTYQDVAAELGCSPRWVRVVLPKHKDIVHPVRRGYRTVKFRPREILLLKRRYRQIAINKGRRYTRKHGIGFRVRQYGNTVHFPESVFKAVIRVGRCLEVMRALRKKSRYMLKTEQDLKENDMLGFFEPLTRTFHFDYRFLPIPIQMHQRDKWAPWQRRSVFGK